MDDREVIVIQLIGLTRELRKHLENQDASDEIMDELINRRQWLIQQLAQACENAGEIGGSALQLLEEDRSLLASANQEKINMERLLAMESRKSDIKGKYRQVQSIRGQSLLVDRTL